MYEYTGLCTEFKIPTNNYQISEAQREMKRRYHQNNNRFLISNDYTYLSPAKNVCACSTKNDTSSISGNVIGSEAKIPAKCC